MKLLSIACAALVATTGFSHAGGAVGVRAGGVAVGVKWGGGRYWGPRYVYGPRYYRPWYGPRYYRPWYGPRYYRPWYGPRVVVAAPPVVVAPRVVAPAVAHSGATYPGSVVVTAQARLQKLGYYRGAVDGAYGPVTAEAIRGFQTDKRLPVTGDLDARTQRSLGL
jgi:hypothetical protein